MKKSGAYAPNVSFGSFIAGPPSEALAAANWRLKDQELPQAPERGRVQALQGATGQKPSPVTAG
jgi:hypothetical protein